jgi:hypothetical protein
VKGGGWDLMMICEIYIADNHRKLDRAQKIGKKLLFQSLWRDFGAKVNNNSNAMSKQSVYRGKESHLAPGSSHHNKFLGLLSHT